MTLTDHKKATRKTWARIAAELTEHAMSRDPDKMNRIFEGRLWRLIGALNLSLGRRWRWRICVGLEQVISRRPVMKNGSFTWKFIVRIFVDIERRK